MGLEISCSNEFILDKNLIVKLNHAFNVLSDEEELGLLSYMFPNVEVSSLEAVSKIAHMTRVNSKSDDAKITYGISTRTSVEIAGLLFDGFSLQDAAEVTIYPQYSDDGGVESEITYIRQLVQKYVNDGTDEDLFNSEEIEEENSDVRM